MPLRFSDLYQQPNTEDFDMKENNNEGPKRTKLHETAENGNLPSFQKIIESMLTAEIVNTDDFNPRDAEGQTPLHLAAKCGHLEICRLILANIVDKNPVNNDGETPSQLAACHGHLPVMELIKSELSKKVKNGYSSGQNKHVVQNNHGGWTKFQNQINVWSGIKTGLARLKSYILGETP